jgi:chorismate lyase/3-hydroxybenzoate synthase
MSLADATNHWSLITDFVVRFGESTSGAGVLKLPIQVLGGESEEIIFNDVLEVSPREGFRLFEREGLLIGAIDEPAEADLSAQAHRLYQRLLTLAEGRRLVRVWNYVSRINAPDANGLENYRAFCLGRSLAFEERLGDGYEELLPGASAVGGVDGRLAVLFTATRVAPAHFENPEQVPAYEYPLEHGPRAPSFARATRVTEAGSRYVFISGTAAIKGHSSISPGDLAGQIACTLDNLRIISRACDLGERLGEGAGWRRHFKVYLRHASDYAAATKVLESALFAPGDRVTWLRSDICRSALLIEIEATLVAAA